MNRQFMKAMFLLQMKKCAGQECISVPNNGCFNYTLEHTTLCSSQHTDKEATHCIQTTKKIQFLLFTPSLFTLKLNDTGKKWLVV